MFKTRITEMLGIKYPIIQGAMARLPQAELVSAVSDAGGLGNLAALSLRSIEEFRQEIKTIRGLTDKPFAVNITMSPRARNKNYEDYIEVAIEEGVGIFEIAGGKPTPFMKRLKSAGAKVIDKVGRIKDARAAEDAGADAISVIGFEAGGRPGADRIGSIALIPMVVDSVKIPVIAGGGIGDARGFVAALALGAEGVLMGTRFMVSRECSLTPETEKRFIEAKGNETVVVEHYANFFGRILPQISGGSAGYGCGQGIGLIHDAPSVKEIIDRIISEASLIKQRLHG
jgi:NAD(P)H-dependent flavin oxidoreductase YrpB (nitropropane dioxygenase family)